MGLRQRDLAERFGVTTGTVALWENERATPLARHCGAIIRFLGRDPHVVEATFAGRLRAIRRRLGLTQKQLAIRAGLDEGSVCRWESGIRRPCRWMAARVEAILAKLEDGAAASNDMQSDQQHTRSGLRGDLSFFDLTRWRRKLPPELLTTKPTALGDRIRRRRLELGLSQEAFGKQFGVGRAAVLRWERGVLIPPKRLLQAIRGFLGCARIE